MLTMHKTAPCKTCGVNIEQPKHGLRSYCDSECKRAHNAGVTYEHITPEVYAEMEQIPGGPDPLRCAEDGFEADALHAAMRDALSYPERSIVERRMNDETYAEIGKALNLTKECVRRTERQAHEKLVLALKPILRPTPKPTQRRVDFRPVMPPYTPPQRSAEEDAAALARERAITDSRDNHWELTDEDRARLAAQIDAAAEIPYRWQAIHAAILYAGGGSIDSIATVVGFSPADVRGFIRAIVRHLNPDTSSPRFMVAARIASSRVSASGSRAILPVSK